MLTLDQIKRAVCEVARACGAQRAVLFGSYARGTATRCSDVDLVIVESTQERFLNRPDKYLAPLCDRLMTGVEVLVYSPEEFERMQGRPFMRRVLQEGVVLYESRELPA